MDQVYHLLARYWETKDWRQATLAVIPRRKIQDVVTEQVHEAWDAEDGGASPEAKRPRID